MNKMKHIMAIIALMLTATAAHAQYIRLWSEGMFQEFSLEKMDSVVFSNISQAPVEEEDRYVDLGLTSGTLWATVNIGANKPEEAGDYFAWGETEGYSVNQKSYDDDFSTYKYYDGENGWTKYYDGDGKSQLEPVDDAATAAWGEEWCMPTQNQMQELKDECQWSYTTLNGTKGWQVTGPNGKTIFLPAAGVRKNTSVDDRNSCYYWTSTLYGSWPSSGMCLYGPEYSASVSRTVRCFGASVRAVRTTKEPQPIEEEPTVDLGLTSGTLWATCNLGAEKAEEAGDVFAWGEAEGYSVNQKSYSSEYTDYKYFDVDADDFTKYNTADGKTTLDPEDDAATVALGEGWHTPTMEQLQELKDECQWEYTTQNEVDGWKVTGPNGNSIFIPAAGVRKEGSVTDKSTCYLWTSTLYSWPYSAYCLYATKTSASVSRSSRFMGLPVRPVYNEPEVVVEHPTVDLGLTSGKLWAVYNIGADKAEDTGDYFAWGETEGYSTSKKDYQSDYSDYKYYDMEADDFTKYTREDAILTLEAEDDAATAAWGEEWRMPTQAEMQELKDECQWEYTTQNGVTGWLATGPNGNTIFFPAGGQRKDGTVMSKNECFYWSASRYESWYGSGMTLYGPSYNVSVSRSSRFFGQPVRAIKAPREEQQTPDPDDEVASTDLGLSSGTLWANCNLGAEKPEQAGDYFAWAETEGYSTNQKDFDPDFLDYKYYDEYDDDMTKYTSSDGLTELVPTDDAATAALGNGWHTPTYEQLQELKDECEWEYATMEGIGGWKVTGPNGNSIFLPAAGQRKDGGLNDKNSCIYWTSTLYSWQYSAYCLYATTTSASITRSQRYLGLTIRPVRDAAE